MDQKTNAKRQEKREDVIINMISSVATEKSVVVFGLGEDQGVYIWDITSGKWKVYANV